MKLNLGSGRVIFPLDRENIPYGEHLLPLPDTCFEPGWVNIDRAPVAGVDEALDLFRFPWIRSSNGSPFPDNSVSEIWAAHIIEHIPHKVVPSDNMPTEYVSQYYKFCNSLDGFFVFFAECWRVLKPDGIIHIRAPLAPGMGAMTDPTHHRYLTPGSFSYLFGQDDTATAPFDYTLPFRYVLHQNPTYRLRKPYTHLIEHYTEEGLGELMTKYNNVVDEFRLAIRAVK